MRALEFIKDHVTFKLHYDFSYQMKTPLLNALKINIIYPIKVDGQAFRSAIWNKFYPIVTPPPPPIEGTIVYILHAYYSLSHDHVWTFY